MAYATNGREIWEIEIGGAIRQHPDFPSPGQLWERFCASEGVESQLEREMLLASFDSSLRDYNLEPKRPRYYQRIAVNRALRAIARGQRRILLTLATGTGKTMVALQLVAKLRKAGWTAGRMPRVLYLADRNILIDQPKDDYFVPAFKDVVHKISKGHAQRSREVYFALYQSLEQGDEQALFTQYEKDYYDLIIVDECHRGSAGSSSRTRAAARYLTQYLYDADRMGKTIIFCENNDHAHRMRVALNNANLDMVNQYENYVCRITGADGDPGKALLDEFSKIGPGVQQVQRLLAAPHELPLELGQDDISRQHPLCQGFQPRHRRFRVLDSTKLSRQADHAIPFTSVTRILGTSTDNDLFLRQLQRSKSVDRVQRVGCGPEGRSGSSCPKQA